jgi:hypothetical protein
MEPQELMVVRESLPQLQVLALPVVGAAAVLAQQMSLLVLEALEAVEMAVQVTAMVPLVQ